MTLFQRAATHGTGNGIEFALSPRRSPLEVVHHNGLRFSIVVGEMSPRERIPYQPLRGLEYTG